MRTSNWMIIGVTLVSLWAAGELLAGRGGGGGGRGGGGGGGGGRGGGGGARPGGGMPAGGGARPGGGMPAGGGGARPGGGMPAGGAGRPGTGHTPSFSSPGGARPAQLPAGRPAGGQALSPGSGRPQIGTRPTQLPAGGSGVGSGGRGQISTLPSTRPDLGGRPGVGLGAGLGAAAGVGLGAAAGAGLSGRPGERPGALPGLGDGGARPSQLPAARTAAERHDALNNRLAGQDRPGQLPARDWNQVRQDWTQQRDQIREDWQQHRDGARDDWQNWFDDHYGRYGGWYAGYAPGYWGRWDYLWDNYPVAAAMGVTWWAANGLGSQFGCGDYANPYYVESMPATYTEPIVTMPVEMTAEAGQPAPALPPGVSAEAVKKFDQARAVFREGKYDEALKLTDEAVAQMPRDAVLNEFRALVLFALRRFGESAATIHPVLAVGPGWDWKTLSSLYADMDTYTAQLRALEAARDKEPKVASLRFLAGYHYLTIGYTDEALGQFRRALELQPKDSVTAALVATLSPRDGQTAQAPNGAAAKPVAPEKVVGNWTAAGQRTAKYSMNLHKDGTFTWAFSRGSRKEQVKGVYSVQGNVLAMEPDTGGVLLAELATKGADLLHFKMIGGASDDPGLEFRRGGST